MLTDAATGAVHPVAMEPGKLVAWPKTGFRQRVEGASPSRWRRILGPMATDPGAAGGGPKALVGLGTNEVICFWVAWWDCASVAWWALASARPASSRCCEPK